MVGVLKETQHAPTGSVRECFVSDKLTGVPLMNWDQIEGNWKQFKGKAKQQWSKLTDDDIGRLSGKREELVGVVQERYGYQKEQAEKEIDNWLKTQKAA